MVKTMKKPFLISGILIISMLLLILSLIMPWYNLNHTAGGALYSESSFKLSYGDISNLESMGLWNEKRVHQATSSPQIFKEPRSGVSGSNYEKSPNIDSTMTTTAVFVIIASLLNIISLIGSFLLLKSKGRGRRNARRIMLLTIILMFGCTIWTSFYFYTNIPVAVNEDIDTTIYPDLYDHITEDNLTFPGSDGRSEFWSTRRDVYDQFSSTTEHERTFTGSDTSQFQQSYFDGKIHLNIVNEFSWGPSPGFLIFLGVTFISFAAMIMVLINKPYP